MSISTWPRPTCAMPSRGSTNSLPDDADAPRVVKADADSDAGPAHRRHLAAAASAQELTDAGQRPGRGPAAGGARRGRPADLRRPRTGVPGRHRPDAAGEPGPDAGRPARRAWATSPSTRPPGALSSDRQSILVRTTAAVTTAEQIEALDDRAERAAGRRGAGHAGAGAGRVDPARQWRDRHRPGHHPAGAEQHAGDLRRRCGRWWPTCSRSCRDDVRHLRHLGQRRLHRRRDPRGRDRAGAVGADRDGGDLPLPARLRARR